MLDKRGVGSVLGKLMSEMTDVEEQNLCCH